MKAASAPTKVALADLEDAPRPDTRRGQAALRRLAPAPLGPGRGAVILLLIVASSAARARGSRPTIPSP